MATVLAPSLSSQRQAIQLLPTRPLRVLSLTPFYPSQENPAQGCFIAEPLQEIKTQGVETEVIAIQPFYRGSTRPLSAAPPSQWLKYFSLPGNFGLPLS